MKLWLAKKVLIFWGIKIMSFLPTGSYCYYDSLEGFTAAAMICVMGGGECRSTFPFQNIKSLPTEKKFILLYNMASMDINSNPDIFFFFFQIKAKINNLVSQAGDRAELIPIGKSFEKRDQLAVKVYVMVST